MIRNSCLCFYYSLEVLQISKFNLTEQSFLTLSVILYADSYWNDERSSNKRLQYIVKNQCKLKLILEKYGSTSWIVNNVLAYRVNNCCKFEFTLEKDGRT